MKEEVFVWQAANRGGRRVMVRTPVSVNLMGLNEPLRSESLVVDELGRRVFELYALSALGKNTGASLSAIKRVIQPDECAMVRGFRGVKLMVVSPKTAGEIPTRLLKTSKSITESAQGPQAARPDNLRSVAEKVESDVRRLVPDERGEGIAQNVGKLLDMMLERGLLDRGLELLIGFNQLPDKEKPLKVNSSCIMALKLLSEWPGEGDLILKGEIVKLRRK